MPGFHAAIRHRQMVAETDMRLVSVPDGLAVTASVHYTTHDPYAVKVVFAAKGCLPVIWVFSRDLLIDGLVAPVGEGDVHIFPAGDSVVFDLASPEGTARLVAGAAGVAAIVDDLLAVVPAGHEADYLDIDAELRALSRELFAQHDDV